MSTTCKIKFHPDNLFSPGQQLHVTVQLKLTEELRVRGIYIQLCGIAHVWFDIDDSGRAGDYANDEDVLDVRNCLVDGNGETRLLPMGTHDYSFTCMLPSDLPSSFSSTHGHIKYSANVIIRMPLWPDKKFEEKFTIYRRSGVSKHSSCISARIPTGGYVSNQTINLQVSVRNTYRSLHHFVVYIMRKTVYHHMSALGEKRKTELEMELKRSVPIWQCERYTHETFPAIKFSLPKIIPPTDTETNKFIKISYFISIKGFKDSREYDMRKAVISLDLPITIGTIPFNDSTSAMSIHSGTRTNSSAPPIAVVHNIRPLEPRLMESSPAFPDDDMVSIRTYASTPPPFPDDDFDLPTYEEAMLMDDEININMHCIDDRFTHVKSTNEQQQKI
ncbi:arrestin domain-containing protein 17-like isoform X2 [Sitodiplosis mosellana]|uniref:arrestin domain-containing protein 17-like isoform X2 n=1 Tax=Sitodiplosis mosellana TaxID=263140 RepID=UPI0024447F6D|nr:arrestin domain-containing protein 17-like isoform X2 [Sitodiplosis mosellana]